MSESTPSDCPFCHLSGERVVAANAQATVVADAFPVAAGHSLIVPRRHVASFFDLDLSEAQAVFELLLVTHRWLERMYHPSGFNVGVNIGAAAGQTVMHAHVHVIPRYQGDVLEPEGGVRNVIPGKGRYRGLRRPEADFEDSQ
jgi:diadenosine tetraphosphate (Ap4A) HIT family hydrolase